jgi:hypothetical protein
VDVYPLFAGREVGLTNIGAGDVHPNQAGYAAIAGALAAAVPQPAAVPEPGSVAALAAAVAAVLAGRLRRGGRQAGVTA